MPRKGPGSPRGASLAVPLVAINGAISTVLAAILATGLYFAGSGKLDEALDREGIALVRSLEALAPPVTPAPGGTGPARGLARGRLDAFVARGSVLAVTVGPTQAARGAGAVQLTHPHGERVLDFSLDRTRGMFLGVPARRFAIRGENDQPVVSAILTEEPLDAAKGKLLGTAMLLGLIVAGCGLAGASTLVTWILSPIRRLTAEMKAAVAGRNTRRVTIRGSGEIRRLALAVEEVARDLADGRVIREEREEVGRELELGAQVQSSLLPERIPMIPGIDIGAYCRPLTEVGGDYYDFLELSGGRLGLGVFDVSGHGVPGAIVMAMVKALLHEIAPTAGGPARTLRRLNAALHSHLARGIFITGIYAEFDGATRAVRLANAGHNPALIHRSATRRMEQLRPGGPALGLAGSDRFDAALREAEVKLDLGDRIVLYTDGAVEIANVADEQFGEKRFHALVAEHAANESNAFVNLVVDELEMFRGSAPPEDDMTIISFAMTV